MEDAAAIADRFDDYVTRDYLDRRLADQDQKRDDALDRQSDQLAARWRRDLLLVSGAQFFALAAAVTALVSLG